MNDLVRWNDTPDRCRRSTEARILAIILAGMTTAGVPVAEAAEPAVREVPAALVTVNPAQLQRERDDNKAIDRARDALSKSGIRLPSDTLKEISLREAVVAALSRNLSIRRGELSKRTAEQAIEEAKALMDPVFVNRLTVTHTSANKRTEKADRYHPATITVPYGQSDPTGTVTCDDLALSRTKNNTTDRNCYYVVFGKGKTVEYVQFDSYRSAGYSKSTVDANDPDGTKPRNMLKVQADFSVYQQLPWGAYLSAGLVIPRQQTYYGLNTQNGAPVTYGSYDRPWSSSFSVSGSVPLPFTRGYGPYAYADFTRTVREEELRATELDIRVIVNATLLRVETAYWGLVGTVQRLKSVERTLASAGETLQRIRRLHAENYLTNADLTQAEANVARIETRRQQVFGEYLHLSEALRDILDEAGGSVFAPVGYRALLDAPVTAGAEADRITENPSYQRMGVALRIASLVREQADVGTRPDLSLSATLSAKQNTSVFGYSSLGGSLKDLVSNPDQLSGTLGLLFRLPWANAPARAAFARAGHSENIQTLLLEKTEAQVREEFQTATIQLASATERSRTAKRSVEIERDLYQRALRLQDEQLVPPYETISRLNALLDAETSVVQADIDARLLHARILASVGALAERYAERSAQTDGDRQRVAALKTDGKLRIFGGPL